MTKWETKKLKDICSKITDGAHLSPPSVVQGLPMASVKDLTEYGIDLTSCRHISEAEYIKLVKSGCKPKKGDILIAKDGNSAIDTTCEVREDMDVVLLSSVAILRPKPDKLLPTFLKHLLSWSSFKNYIKQNFITGAAIPRVILKDFGECDISIPPLPVQRKISAVLSAYDDLIENNTRRIALLEKM
ncbi:MAG: restriction endonuclease subunit S, partial [Nodosilinea sp.]